MTDQITFERIRQGTDNFNSDWLAAMTQEERVVADLTIVSDINKNHTECSDVLSKQQTIDMIADRYKLERGWVDGKYCIIFKTRPLIHWDNQLLIWKFGTMS